jgi:transposase-like protein
MRWWLLASLVAVTVLILFVAFDALRVPKTDAGAALGNVNGSLSARGTRAPPPPVAAREAGSAAALPDTNTPGAKPTVARINSIERKQLQAAIREAREREQSAARERVKEPGATTSELTPEEQRAVKEGIRKQISEVTPLLAECYELEVAKSPELQGSLKLHFTIDGEPGVGGIVSDSVVVGGTLAEQSELGTCITETIYTLKFEPPKAGGTVEVEYPFVFGRAPK